jgi:ankyrin repeat protein
MGWFTSKQARLNQKLRSACSAGKLRDILLLLAEGADINAKDSEGAAPLVYAISTRRSEAVELLIAKGADVGINKVGKTPLMFACASGDPKIVGLLLETGTDVNAKNPGCYGWTAATNPSSACLSKKAQT